MKNEYGHIHKKNLDSLKENSRSRHNNIHSIVQDINIGKKLNIYSSYSNHYGKKINKREFNKNSSNNSFSKSNNYLMNYQSNKISHQNNHLLFDSNKQRIINPGYNNFVQFKPSNKKKRNIKYTNIKNYGKISLKSIFLNKENNANNEDKYIKTINNLKRYSRKNTINDSRNKTYNNNNLTFSYHQKTYNNYSNKKEKSANNSLNTCNCYNHIKIPSIQHRNHYVFNISNNKTKGSSNDYSPNHSQSTKKNLKSNYLKNIIVNDNNNNKLNETNKNNNNKINSNVNNEKTLSKKNTLSFMTKIYGSPKTINNNNTRNKLNLIDNTIINNSNKYKLEIPMILNIKNTSKEKLSRIKRIIEKSATNHNSQQLLDFLKNNSGNRTIKSVDKKNIIKREKDISKKYIFKKKKIMSLKEKDKEGLYLQNKNHQKNNLILSKIIKTNTNQIQSSVASYNLFVHKKNNNLSEKLNTRENDKDHNNSNNLNNTRRNIVYYTDIYNMNNNTLEDTINLSNSKKFNISISSKNKKNEEKSIALPFITEQFNLYYNIHNKKLIINDKNFCNDTCNKKNNINHDSDDEEYLLTKEILLLKKGLAKKNELSKEIRRKMRHCRIKRIAEFSLYGNGAKKIYKKKTGNYKNHRF